MIESSSTEDICDARYLELVTRKGQDETIPRYPIDQARDDEDATRDKDVKECSDLRAVAATGRANRAVDIEATKENVWCGSRARRLRELELEWGQLVIPTYLELFKTRDGDVKEGCSGKIESTFTDDN